MKPFRSSRNKFDTLKNELRNMLNMRQVRVDLKCVVIS